MAFRKTIFLLWLNLLQLLAGNAQNQSPFSIDFLGEKVEFPYNQSPYLIFDASLKEKNIQEFFDKINSTDYRDMVNSITRFRDDQKLDDWLFYQLIRKTAQQICPKAKNYNCYTLYKWFLLIKSGYDAILRISENKILFYVQSDETIYNIPFRIENNKQYVCLNYHDYGSDIDFEKEQFRDVIISIPGTKRSFTYKVTHLPDFKPDNYVVKDLQFNYYQQQYHFKIKLNPQVKTLFTNYPVGEYSNHFNIPLSKQTYNSLIPPLKDIVRQMNTISGVDYLMRFTRYAFLYERDSEVFGREKRLSPEETLLYDQSDCEDRAALFFFLVKEIYALPMIVLAYPNHVTVAVKFDKPVGKPILYNGTAYYVCEPTPQKKDLSVGQMLPKLKKENFEIAYVYQPPIR
jgi:hypothetical protein